MSFLFISYSSQNREYVYRLADKLRDEGFDIWIDNDALRAGDEWWDEIVKALNACAGFVVLMTPQAQASKWVKREIALADELNKPPFPILLSGARFPIYVTTQFETCLDGNLPSPRYFSAMEARGIPRRRGERGRDLSQARAALSRLPDAPAAPLEVPAPLSPMLPPEPEIAALATLEMPIIEMPIIAPSSPEPLDLSTLEVDVVVASAPVASSQSLRLYPPSPVPIRLEQAYARARAFTGTHNADWTPILARLGELVPQSPMPDLVLCLVPAGSFWMGQGSEAHRQRLAQSFWIARTPTSNAQWRMAVQAGAVKAPAHRQWYDDPRMADSPVVHVNLWDCQRFAQWAGCDLPSEREWEYAARGVQSWLYPWGDDFDADLMLYQPPATAEQVGLLDRRPNAGSWVGAVHLIGNVWEWTRSAYAPYPYGIEDGREQLDSPAPRALRGGSFFYSSERLRSADRYTSEADARNASLGFRCMLAAQP